MSKDKARALFLQRFDALVSAVKSNPEPVIHINSRDWHWIAPLTVNVDGAIRYQGVEIKVVDHD